MNIGTVKKSRPLSFVCLLALLAVVAAASPASAAVISLATGGSGSDSTTGGGSYSWSSNKLTLAGTTSDSFAITGTGPVTIETSGNATVNVSGADPAINVGSGISVTIQGTSKANTLTLTSAQSDGLFLGGGDLTVDGIKLKATGHGHAATPSTYGGGFAGIWVYGSIKINNADVEASGISEVNVVRPVFGPDPVFGIFAYTGNIEITGDSVVKAQAEQHGTPEGGRAAGIFSSEGDITISGTASVTATANSKSAAAGGIYSEYGEVIINSTGTVTASAESQSSDPDEENQGLGIAAGKNVAITNATVSATGKSARGESAGIAAAVPDITGTPGSGNVAIAGDADVTAEGLGNEGHGIVVEGTGNVTIDSGATATAIAHGTGYAIETATGTITNDGTATLKADDETHYSNVTVGGNGTTTESPNTPPARSSRGGCDAGFGSFAALFALGMSLVIRRKRP